MDLKFVRTDLVQLISDCVSNFKNVDPEREFIFIPPVEKLEISIDPIRIEQVLANLLENACRYSTAKQKIEIKLEQFPGRVMVSVSDSGPGISKEQQELLFSRFYRIKSDQTIKNSGLGLGLFICRGMIELHGGKIGVKSAPGSSSTFYFELLNDLN